MRHLALVVALLLAVAAAGCGKGKATASLRLQNDTALSARLAQPPQPLAATGDARPVVPTLLGIKLVAVYLAEGVDPVTQDNLGTTSMIWLNPECAGDISRCGPDEASAHRVTSFFDFAQGTEAVNAALNAQGLGVEPATYRYARIEFCKFDPGATPNLAWQAGAMSAPATATFGGCAVTSAPFAEPLTLADGDAVQVTLAYDLAAAVMAGTAFGQDLDLRLPDGSTRWFLACADAGTERVCVDRPDFTPSASAVAP